MKKEAILSACGKYRYRLDRAWEAMIDTACLFIMLNPSTADAYSDDPTIRKCLGFTRALSCNHLVVVNLFAYRATKPSELKRVGNPVGILNGQYIDEAVDFVRKHGDGPVICAWGAHGGYDEQDEKVLELLLDKSVEPLCFGRTKEDHPKHPLYLRYNSKLKSMITGLTSSAWPLNVEVGRTLFDEVAV